MKTARPRNARRRAVMLLLVLWIVTILTMMVYSTIYQMTLETRVTSTRKKTLQAKVLARAGLARGFVDLRNDMISDASEEEDKIFDAEGDYWADMEEGKEKVEMGPGTFTVVVRDEERLFNINSFNASNRVLLEKIIEQVGYDEEDAKVTASAIIDYADGDEQPVLDSAPGDEGLAYGMVRAEDEGGEKREEDVERVNFPNEPYLTVESLLDVYGVTPDLFFGPKTPEAEEYRKRTKMEEPKGERFEIEEKRRISQRDEKPIGLRDFFTTQGSGSLNLNTAPAHVLQALLEAAGRSDADRLAERIIRDRRGGKSRRVDNDNAFKSTADFSRNADLAPILGAIQAMHPVDVRSSVFTLTSTGRVGQVSQTLEVTVTRSLAEIQRDEKFKTIERAEERQKRLEGRRERWQDKKSEQIIRIPCVRILQWNKPGWQAGTPDEEDN